MQCLATAIAAHCEELILPMAWDGTTQLFGWRESTWALRVITGTLFGGGTVWFSFLSSTAY